MATIVTRSGKGSALTHDEMDDNLTNLNTDKLENLSEDTTPQLGGNLDTNGNNINFGDSASASDDRLTFGASNDLQIFHSGTHSWINDTGTGQLYIQSNGDAINVTNSSTRNLAQFNTSAGTVTLYHDNGTTSSAKLATTSTGVSVTGNVTADGLTVDGDVTIQKNNPTLLISDTGTADQETRIQQISGSLYIRPQSSASGDGSVLIDGGYSGQKKMLVSYNGDISFYEDTGTTAKFYWDASAEALGINTTSPNRKVEIVGFARITKEGGTGGDAALEILAGEVSGQSKLRFSDINDLDVGEISYDHSDNSMRLRTNGSERMRITNSGNVGIGTSSPADKLEVAGNILLNATDAEINLRSGATGTSGAINWTFNTNSTNYTSIKHPYDTRNTIGLHIDSGYPITIDASGIGTVFAQSGSEKMRIDSNGRIQMGTTSTAFSERLRVHNGASYTITSTRTGTGNEGHMVFQNGNGAVGTIFTNGTSTSYNTSSDYRLKENVVDMDGAIDRVKALQPRRFNFIADANTTVDGFIAHEVSDVVPEAISGEKDAVDDEGNPEYQGIDQSKLVPLLTGALQEAIAKIEALETRIETLEGA